MLTGVRGVPGKTNPPHASSPGAQLVGSDGKGGPDGRPAGAVCDNLQGITEDRHVDVIEMERPRARIDDVRELIEGVRYGPVRRATSVYISTKVTVCCRRRRQNALLTTLEAPPPHVKCLFATTEIRKVHG